MSRPAQACAMNAKRAVIIWLALGALACIVFVAALTLGSVHVSPLRALAAPLFALVLGPQWQPAVPLFRIFVVNMALGALIAVLVAYLRACGDARAAAQASAMQVVVLVAVVPIAVSRWGAVGIAWGMTSGLVTAGAWMLYRTLNVRVACAPRE